MTNPVAPAGAGGSGNPISGSNQFSVPPGPPLPANDPWVKNMAAIFPGVAIGVIQMFAGKFRDNMFQSLNTEINRDLKRARAAAKKFKDAIEGND